MKTILAIDDSASIRRMLAFTLKGAGYAVIEATDGEEGLKLARHNEVSLVVTDHNMPKMDGLSLIRTLRGMKEYRNTPLLMLTTESSDEMKAQGRAAGATGWVVKPFDPARLLQVVKKVIG